ncbi:hypothetical protein ABZ154_07035 [Streptomyces sp. NPDC006261]
MSVVKVSGAVTALPRARSSRVLGRVGTAAVKIPRMDEGAFPLGQGWP